MRHFFSKKSGDQPRYHVIQFLGANLHLTIELISKAKERCPRRDAKVASKYRFHGSYLVVPFETAENKRVLRPASVRSVHGPVGNLAGIIVHLITVRHINNILEHHFYGLVE